MQHILLHISLSLLYDYDVKLPSSTFWVNVNKRRRNFFLSPALNLDMVLKNSTPEAFACIRQRRWVGIIAIEIEKLRVSLCKRCFRRRRRRGILNSILHDMRDSRRVVDWSFSFMASLSDALWYESELRVEAVTCLASLNVEKQHRTNNVPQNPASGQEMIPGYTENATINTSSGKCEFISTFMHWFLI